MIFGIGTDICACSRFLSWINDKKKCSSFFNKEEIPSENYSDNQKMEHYASRFAAKEAFVKALGTGFKDFKYSEIYVTNDKYGKPILNVTGKAKSFLESLISDYNIHISLSHEKDYAVAFVIIETDSR